MGNSHVTPFIIYMVASDIFFFTPIPGEMMQFDVRIVGLNPPPYVTHRQGRGAPTYSRITDFFRPSNVENFFVSVVWLRTPHERPPGRMVFVIATWSLRTSYWWRKLLSKADGWGRKKRLGKKLGRKEKKGGFIFIWKGPKKGKFMKLLNVVRNDPTGDYIYMICSIICICI